MSNPDQISDAELLARIDRALRRLPAKRRNIFLLSRIERWTYQRIACAYGISTKRARRHVVRAMHVLMAEVDDNRPQPFWRRWF